MRSEAATIDIDTMRAAAAEACRLMKVLANPDRLLLLCQLAEGERCPSDLEAALGIVQPTLSQQLGVLRDEGLVATRREGKHIHYRLSSERARAVMQMLYSQFCQPSIA
ncbi:ArsR family transcriptional regulator [beta proteobacterium AAP121]|nr:ArsR family transcriptional regulator [beta proteobacterium AAP65]KPF99964.1 ArsR family transcriptional regulator [beta proteobacterium AAP121]